MNILNGCIADHHKDPNLFDEINNAENPNDAINLFVSNAGAFPHLIYSSTLNEIKHYFTKSHIEKIIDNIGSYEHPTGTLSHIIDLVIENPYNELGQKLWNKIEKEHQMDVKNPKIIVLAANIFGEEALSVLNEKS